MDANQSSPGGFRGLSVAASRVRRVKTVELGRTGLRISRLGLGLASLGGMFATVPEEQAVATIDRAWDRGVRLFDTAPVYGYGLSEQRAGLALRGRPREELVLCSKVGRLIEPGGPDLQPIWAEPPAGVGPHGYSQVPRELAERITALRRLTDQYGVPLLAAALQFRSATPQYRPWLSVPGRRPRCRSWWGCWSTRFPRASGLQSENIRSVHQAG